MKGALFIEWRSDERTFEVLSAESIHDQFPVSDQQSFFLQNEGDEKQTTDRELAQLSDDFQDCWDARDFATSMTAIQGLRTRVLTQILATSTPLRWLPNFLVKWQDLVLLVGNDDTKLRSTDLVDYFQELVAVARGWMVIGDTVHARSVLEKCFRVARQQLKAPFAQAVATECNEKQAVRRAAQAAKKVLLVCVAFQTSLDRNKNLLARHEAPLHVLASLSNEFWFLLHQAPLSVQVALLLTQTLMKQGHFALVTRFLENSPFSGVSAELGLMHAKALAYTGFSKQSIAVAQSFVFQENQNYMALRAYCDQMKDLLRNRERSEELLRMEHFEEAAASYAKCLALIDPANHKQLAALLFGHANALLGLEKLPKAIIELQKSLALDPANKIASVRLQTACMQLETERIKNELSGTQSKIKLQQSL